MTQLRHALTVANLCRMGYEATRAMRIGGAWRQRQHELLPAAIGPFLAGKRIEEVGLPDDVGGKIFMSCHFSAYQIVLRSLAQRMRGRPIHCLIGSQSEDHARLLVALAREFDIAIDFIEAGASMLKTIRSVLRAGGTIFVLFDVPWGVGTAPDLDFPFIGGRLQARSALFRMARNLGFEHHFTLVTHEGDTLRVTDHGTLEQEHCYALLRHAVEVDPASYERLYELHKYFEPVAVRDVLVCFKVGEEGYALHGRDMKTWKLPSHPFEAGSATDKASEHRHAEQFTRIERLLQRPVAELVSL